MPTLNAAHAVFDAYMRGWHAGAEARARPDDTLEARQASSDPEYLRGWVRGRADYMRAATEAVQRLGLVDAMIQHLEARTT